MRRIIVVVVALTACGESSPSVPLASAPWPKFRADARQTGRSALHGAAAGGVPWSFPTGKGVFSSPVVAADGTIYVGSADRYFYALHPDGTLAWKYQTGEIIDSAALLDDRGRVYVGSGDGHVYAFDAATGDQAWAFTADPPGPSSLINWFEGNVAIGPDGTLYAGNDNFHIYGLDRDGTQVWRTDMPDQTWSSPAIDPATGRLAVGNNAMVSLLGANLWSLDSDGTTDWRLSTSNGSIAASPMIARNGEIVVGGFDGYVHAFAADNHEELWTFATRDHIYASPAELPDGTIVQPSTDGTIYALDPDTGALRWSFDTLEPIRSSPAVDADGRIYVGSGEGRLFVLDPDGTLRWSLRLIDALRNDLNASPALGKEAIYLAGESGEVFGVPYDYCLQATDARCSTDEALPTDAVQLWVTTPLGAPLATPPAQIDANRPLTLTLVARQAGHTILAPIDSASIAVTVTPDVPITFEVSADRRFLVITPQSRFTGPAIDVHVTGRYLVDPDRDGLKMTGGKPGGPIDQTLHLSIAAPPVPAYALHVPTSGDDAATALELYRLAAPLPTIMPSYNQIGFDSLHYIAGLVEGSGDHYVAWVVGGKLDAGDRTVVDPATKAVFALDVDATGGLVSFANNDGFSLEVMGATLSFRHFLITAALGADGTGGDSPALVVSTPCADIELYGPFLASLGLCNPDTGTLLVSGGLLIRPFGAGTIHAPAGVGSVAFAAEPMRVRATLTGTTLVAGAHSLGVLLVDAATGKPVSLDYGLGTHVTANADGTVASVDVAVTTALAGSYRAYLMVDAYPAATATLAN
jgi:outer membrane protein assembly factor BamB